MTNYFNSGYNSVYNNRSIPASSVISAISIMNNIQKSDIVKKPSAEMSSVKSLLMQVQAMAELDKFNPIGKKLDITI